MNTETQTHMKIAHLGGFLSTQHAADAIHRLFLAKGVDVHVPEHGEWTLSVPVDWDLVQDAAAEKEMAADKVYNAWRLIEPFAKHMECTLSLRWHPNL
jgi:hypothetical protein